MIVIDLDERRRSVNGLELHTIEAGSGPPVVLLHGFPEFWYSWRFQIEPLVAAGYRVVAPDLRGYNRSEKPSGSGSYSIEHVADDIVALCEALGGNVALVGHDWGGVVAWRVAKVAPQLLRSLVVLNIPHPAALNEKKSSPRQMIRFWYQLALQPPVVTEVLLRANRCYLLRRMLQRMVLNKSAVTERDLAMYVDAWRQPGALTGMVNYYRAIIRRRPRTTVRQTTPSATPAAMLIAGDREPVFLRETLEASSRFLPSLRFQLVEGAGHFVHHDRADEVNRLLLDFIGKHSGG